MMRNDLIRRVEKLESTMQINGSGIERRLKSELEPKSQKDLISIACTLCDSSEGRLKRMVAGDRLVELNPNVEDFLSLKEHLFEDMLDWILKEGTYAA